MSKTEPVIEQKIINVPVSTYYPSNGQFLYKSPAGWQVESCRERLHNAGFQIDKKKNVVSVFDEFFMGVLPHCGDRVIKFMKIVDAASRSEEPVEVSPTNISNIIHIKMPKWWANNLVRRNVLTAFLRAGTYYREESGKCFEDSLNSISYLRETRPAVDLFLSGGSRIKNKKSDGFNGWYNCFRNNTNPERILVKIKRKHSGKPETENPATEQTGVE